MNRRESVMMNFSYVSCQEYICCPSRYMYVCAPFAFVFLFQSFDYDIAIRHCVAKYFSKYIYKNASIQVTLILSRFLFLHDLTVNYSPCGNSSMCDRNVNPEGEFCRSGQKYFRDLLTFVNGETLIALVNSTRRRFIDTCVGRV